MKILRRQIFFTVFSELATAVRLRVLRLANKASVMSGDTDLANQALRYIRSLFIGQHKYVRLAGLAHSFSLANHPIFTKQTHVFRLLTGYVTS